MKEYLPVWNLEQRLHAKKEYIYIINGINESDYIVYGMLEKSCV